MVNEVPLTTHRSPSLWTRFGGIVSSLLEPQSQEPTVASGPPLGQQRNADGAVMLANDLRLMCTPRQAPPGRLAHLLELAFRAVRTARAGIALLTVEGELIEHLSMGMTSDEAVALEQCPAFLRLLHVAQRQPAPTRLQCVTACEKLLKSEIRNPKSEAGSSEISDFGFRISPALADLGPFLAVPLSCAGRSRGILYLSRHAK